MTRRTAPLLAALLSLPLAAGERASPPSSRCADARAVQEVVQGDDHTLAVRLADESRFRIDLAARCPAIGDEPGVRLVSPAGWVCGRTNEWVVSATRTCPIAHVARIDAKAFSAHALQAQRAPRPELIDRVEVKGSKRRGFAGSPAYCLNTNHMRGWHEDANGIVVEVSPLRSGGHRFYRVELGASCHGLTDGAHLSFRSGVGGAMVCGYAGDRAIFQSDLAAQDGLVGGFIAGGFEGPIGERSRVGRGVAGSASSAAGCPVALVYPIDPRQKRDVASVRPER